MLLLKKPMEPNFQPLSSMGSMAMIRPKSQNSNKQLRRKVSERRVFFGITVLCVDIFPPIFRVYAEYKYPQSR
jgi:hypothetical protein